MSNNEIWCSPVLPVRDYVVWAGCGFLDPLYYRGTINKKTGLGSVHTGTDFNLKTGGNSDLGKPLRALSDAIVTHAKDHRVWGKIVLARSKYGRVWWQAAHLDQMFVKVGDSVLAGEQIGTIGRGGKDSNGDYYYYAHAHVEIRTEDLPADEWPSVTKGRADAERYIAGNRRDVVKFLAERGAARTLEELASLRALATPAPVIPAPPTVIPGSPPPNWHHVRDPATGIYLPADWVSEVSGEFYRVPDYKLKERGLS